MGHFTPSVHLACVTTLRAAAIAMLFLCAQTTTTRAENFYAGKVITIVVSGQGAYERYARTFSHYMPAHIPGHPAMIVRSMPGASGIKATTYLAKVAPRDGTVIAAVHGAVITSPLLTPGAAQYDVNALNWIGNATRDVYLAYVWHTVPVYSVDDLRTKPIIIGGTSIGGASIDMALIAKNIFGFNIKIVTGYAASNDTKLAMERGEVQGTMASGWSSLAQTDWFQTGKVRVIMQHGSKKRPELQNVPMFIELARSENERKMIRLMEVREEIAKPYVAPPGVPAERVAILRKAFDDTMKDPAFLADMAAQHMEIDEPLNGQDLTTLVSKISKTPPSVVEQLQTLFADAKGIND